MEKLASKWVEDAVDQFATLPGIGRQTALRFAMFMLGRKEQEVERFAQTMLNLKQKVKSCCHCHMISDEEECRICSDQERQKSTICVVESTRDIMAIESTHQFDGVYHVLGGVISPMDGVGPSDLNIDSLLERLEKGDTKEVVLALSTTMEGDTTNFYLYRKLEKFDVNLTALARGVAIGGDIRYTDELTLGRSILNRVPYSQLMNRS